MLTSPIHFGTSGYRGIIGSTFTQRHVVVLATAIVQYLKYKKISNPSVFIGYDTRTGNSPSLADNSYTHPLVACLTNHRIRVDFSETFCPTPVVSWAVREHAYDLGIILSASHNPPNYNGLKINDDTGAPAPIQLTTWIADAANVLMDTLSNKSLSISKDFFKTVSYTNAFIDHLHRVLVHTFGLDLPSFSDTYVIDLKCGSSIGIWQQLTQDHTGTIHWRNNNYSSDFNFKIPNPTDPESLAAMQADCKQYVCIGFANDPDADRHLMIDEYGEIVSPEKITAIIIDYMMAATIPVGSVATTLANSVLVKQVCAAHHIRVKETCIGFKYIADSLKSATSRHIIGLGVESSGGFSASIHTYDKCGFLPILVILGIMQKTNARLHDLAKAIDARYGTYSFSEDHLVVSEHAPERLLQIVPNTPERLSELLHSDVREVITKDGIKILFTNHDWALVRLSGTEPVIRLYAESRTPTKAHAYIQTLKAIFSKALDG